MLKDTTTKLTPAIKPESGVYMFTILARIIQDPRFPPRAIGLPVSETEAMDVFGRIEKAVGEVLLEYIWKGFVDGGDAVKFEEKLEELVWMNTHPLCRRLV